MYDIITIGAGTRDVFLVSDKFKFIESSVFESGVGECVSLGSKIDVETVVHSTGGGATNAASTFSRLGFSCSTVCNVGDDHAGSDLILDLHRDGINTTMINRKKGQTGYSTLLTDKKTGERSVLVHRGVSAKFTKSDIPYKDCIANWFYLTSLAGNLTLAKDIIRHAHKCGGSITWNPGGGEIKKGLKQMQSVMRYVTILNINREEAESLTKEKDLSKMFKKLAHRRNVVIITDGPNGAYAHQSGETYFAKTNKVKAVSRTGAGDAFGSGFTASFMKDGNLRKALGVGTLNAEGVIASIGAKTGIIEKWPTAAQLKRAKIKKM